MGQESTVVKKDLSMIQVVVEGFWAKDFAN